jgi:solute carrier family 6 amino acid/orphan transporter-like 15/16/17/18/20
MKGIESSGNVVYFTALFPYIVMTIFFIRGITLKGAMAGLTHMFSPKMEALLKPQVWMDAANQVFYSYGLAFGSMISFGSYNPTDKNCVKDVLYLSLCNACTAVYACAVIFSILGFKAQHLFDACMESDVSQIMKLTNTWPGRNASSITEHEYEGLMTSHALNESIFNPNGITLKNCSLTGELDQAAQGTGLAFIVMADVFTKLPGAPFWSLLFFSMLLSLGIGSQIGILEGSISTLFDMPTFKNFSKPVLSGTSSLKSSDP